MRVALQRREMRQRKKIFLIKRKEALKEEKARVLQRREEEERRRGVAAIAVQVRTVCFFHDHCYRNFFTSKLLSRPFFPV